MLASRAAINRIARASVCGRRRRHLLPALQQVAVAHAAQRQVAEVAAQVGGH